MADENQVDMKQMFTNLANGAASGQLIIEDGVADKCIQHCQDFLVDLKEFTYQCGRLVHVESFGSLKSATELGNSFHKLADGDTGMGSLKEAIQARIEAVMALEEMLKKAKESFLASDEDTKDKIRQAMKNIDG